MTTQLQTAADTAIARLGMIGEREDLKALPDDMLLGRWLGKNSLTLGDARAVAAWAREMGKPVPPAAGSSAHPMAAEPKEYEWKAALVACERAIFAAPEIDIVVVCGPEGSGKTRLVHELIRATEDHGPVACYLPNAGYARQYDLDMGRKGLRSGAHFFGHTELSSRWFRFAFLEELESFPSDPITRLNQARLRVHTHKGGKVLATIKSEVLADALARHLPRSLVIRLAPPTAQAEAA